MAINFVSGPKVSKRVAVYTVSVIENTISNIIIAKFLYPDLTCDSAASSASHSPLVSGHGFSSVSVGFSVIRISSKKKKSASRA
ncbi:MAG: hypothetical protein KAU52_01830, partial [Methanosarcinales archaeon]|nr:hypothetical protein [Methanosarcinales archaeon]